LASKRPDLVKTPTGKNLDDITLDSILNGSVKSEDVRITPDTLRLQAQIAEGVGRTQFANNLRRAAELTAIPDARLLEIYNALRPYRSSKRELLDIAQELETQYDATINAAMVREAADVYERRNRLKAE
jgi:propanediol dehydratase small subunit